MVDATKRQALARGEREGGFLIGLSLLQVSTW